MKKPLTAITTCDRKTVLSFLVSSFVLASLGTPLFAIAQVENTEFGTLYKTVQTVAQFVQTIIPILIAFIFLFFLYNVFKFVSTEEDKEAARSNMLWSIVGIAVFSTVWGAVAFLRNITGITNEAEDVTGNDIVIPGSDFRGFDSTTSAPDRYRNPNEGRAPGT